MNMANFEYRKGTVLDFSSLLDHAPAEIRPGDCRKDGHLALEKTSPPHPVQSLQFYDYGLARTL